MRKLASAVAVAVLAVSPTGMANMALADGADKKCQCRFQGQRYNVGEYACIRSKIARCDMFLNNTTWTFLEDSCGISKLQDPPSNPSAAGTVHASVLQ